MSFPKKKKQITKRDAYLKACHYCAYQERLQEEVRQKLKTFMLSDEEMEEIISDLILNNFLNEERFAKAYSGGKFRIKKWGRLKIRRSLETKGVSEYCIKKGLTEIDEEDYNKTLQELIISKRLLIQEENSFQLNHKLASYAIGKGYEPDLVWEILKSIK